MSELVSILVVVGFVLLVAWSVLHLIFRAVQGIWSSLNWRICTQRGHWRCDFAGRSRRAVSRPRGEQAGLPAGRRADRHCPNLRCQKANVPEALFCGRCGWPLGGLDRGSTRR